jgi:hypothetical protein
LKSRPKKIAARSDVVTVDVTGKTAAAMQITHDENALMEKFDARSFKTNFEVQFSVLARVARWYFFTPKMPILVFLGRSRDRKYWRISWPFGIYIQFWYILLPFFIFIVIYVNIFFTFWFIVSRYIWQPWF